MCGIAGIFGGPPLNDSSIARTLDAMRERGPDSNGVWKGELRRAPITLLHTRLSIIDLDERADQPFEKDGIVVAFNGEIYNYLELRAELEALQHRFVTHSDTEVIVEAYRRWGPDCVDRLEGMWAFALVDTCDGSLILVRDRFGEKPLYYVFDPASGALFFASETRFLWPLGAPSYGPDKQHVRRFLVNGYKALFKQPGSFHAGIRQLPPSSYAVLQMPAEPEATRYWNLRYDPEPISQADAEEETQRLVDDAVRLRLRADVPIAFCLSGGVDSTTLAAIAHGRFGQHIHAYSIYDTDARYDESENIETMVRNLACDHHIVHTSKDGFIDRMRSLGAYHDAPVATISFYIESFLAEAIREAGYKVAVTGTGADELFSGYYDHYNFWLADMQNEPNFDDVVADWRIGSGQFVRNPVLSDPLCFAVAPDRRDHIYLNRDVFAELLIEPFDEGFEEAHYDCDLLHRRLLNEINYETLPLMLDQNDLVFMQHSVENRTPFLDRNLAEFLFRLPAKYLIQNGYSKWMLRAAAADRVPDSVRLDRRKRGFNAPIASLFDASDANAREFLLADGPIFEIVDKQRFSRFLDLADERNSFSKFLFAFISARLFLENAGAQAA